MPCFHQPPVAMATTRLVLVKQYLLNFTFSFMKSQIIRCVHFIKFAAKLYEWQILCQYLSIAPHTIPIHFCRIFLTLPFDFDLFSWLMSFQLGTPQNTRQSHKVQPSFAWIHQYNRSYPTAKAAITCTCWNQKAEATKSYRHV